MRRIGEIVFICALCGIQFMTILLGSESVFTISAASAQESTVESKPETKSQETTNPEAANPETAKPASQPSTAEKEPTNPAPAVTTLNPVVISATRTERTVSDLPVSATVLTEEDIAKNPSLATDDILRAVPSINFSSYLPSYMQHPTSNFVSIRGLGGGLPHVLFLMDGIPLNDPFFGYVDFNRVPKEQIERIEVVRGGSSSLWGSFAEGGVVNIVTKRIDSTGIEQSAMGGTYSTFRENLFASKKINEDLGIGLGVNYFSTAGYDAVAPEERGTVDRRTSSHSANINLKMDYHTADFEGFVRGNYFENHQILDTNLNTNETHTVNLATGGRLILDAQNDIKTNLFYLNQNFVTNNADFVSPPSRDAEFLSNIHQTPATDMGASVQWTRTSAGVLRMINAGMDVRNIEGVDNSDNTAPPPTSTVSVLNGGGQQLFLGWFGQASLFPTSDWEILPSLRLDYVLNYQGSLTNNPGTTTELSDKHYLQLNPKIATRYQIVKEVAIRASVYRGFRAPTLDNLFRSYSSQGFVLNSNSQLNPEVLWGGDIGFDVTAGRFQGQVNFFDNRITDQINYVTTSFGPPFTQKVENIGETSSIGVEAIGDVQLTKEISSGVSWSWTDAKIRSNPSNPSIVGQQTFNTPLNAVSGFVRYRHSSGAYLEVDGRYVTTALDSTGIRMDAHKVFDASASCPIYKHVEAFLFAQNITDEKYVASTFGATHLGTPFQIFGGIRVTFGGIHG